MRLFIKTRPILRFQICFGVVSVASHLLKDWKEAQIKVEERRIRVEMGARVWSPPKEGWLKINIYAALFLDSSTGVAAVVRVSQARFIAARGNKIAWAWKPREAEVIGLNEALSWTIEREYTHCVFEIDSYVLVAVCNDHPGEAGFGMIVMDYLYLLKHVNR